MPLDFNQPRAAPTLNRRKSRREIWAETRERFPVGDIILGLRSQGGLFTTRDPGQTERINRYIRDLRAQEDLSQATRSFVVPEGYTPFSDDEFESAVKALLKGEAWERGWGDGGRLIPQVRIHYVPAQFVHRFDFYGLDPVGGGGAMGIQMQVSAEELAMAQTRDLAVLIANTLKRGYYALAKLELKNGATPKKVTIPEH
jgi:hypothetical protein